MDYNQYPGYGNYLPQRQSYQPQPTQYPQNQMNVQQGYTCRPVTSREEAIASQIDFFSPGVLMPDFSHGKIFFKRFNSNTGAADFMEFVFQQPQETQTEKPIDNRQDIENILKRINYLEEEVSNITKSAKKNSRGVKNNDTDDE